MPRIVKQEYCVSLMEPVMLVKAYMRANYATNPAEFLKDGVSLLKVMDYPSKLYMNLLCQAIFNTPSSHRGGADYELEQAEKLLIKDGMKHHVVKEVTQRVFEMCVDILAVNFPSLTFMDEQIVDFEMINEFDLRVVVPVDLDALGEPNRGY